MRLLLIALIVGLVTAPALAQEAGSCPEFQGITCDGWVTDDAGVLANEATVEVAANRFVAKYGHDIAVVTVANTGTMKPRDFAEDLGNTWGVGDPELNDGIVVLVALAERRTEIVTGPGLPIGGLDLIASSADGFFADGDFDGGLVAIITSLSIELSGETTSRRRRLRTRLHLCRSWSLLCRVDSHQRPAQLSDSGHETAPAPGRRCPGETGSTRRRDATTRRVLHRTFSRLPRHHGRPSYFGAASRGRRSSCGG